MICFLLGWIGSLPVMSPFFEIGQLVTFFYFFYFFCIFPFTGLVEKIIYHLLSLRSQVIKCLRVISRKKLFNLLWENI
jgi:hypothetical protein